MKYEINPQEVMEQLEELGKELLRDLLPPKLERQSDFTEAESSSDVPPKLERSEFSEGEEQPPKLERGEQNDMQEYYKAKKEKLQAEMDARNRQQFLRRAEVNYGTPTTESGWKAEAAKEYNKWGKETSYYHHCMEEAANAHVNGR